MSTPHESDKSPLTRGVETGISMYAVPRHVMYGVILVNKDRHLKRVDVKGGRRVKINNARYSRDQELERYETALEEYTKNPPRPSGYCNIRRLSASEFSILKSSYGNSHKVNHTSD
jgi:hypothetical protein